MFLRVRGMPWRAVCSDLRHGLIHLLLARLRCPKLGKHGSAPCKRGLWTRRGSSAPGWMMHWRSAALLGWLWRETGERG
jgi:hypothetical protein